MTNTPTEDFRTRCMKALTDRTIVGDGHSIVAPEFYAPHFSENELREAGLVHSHFSDLSHEKSTIFDHDGVPIEELKDSVYNLAFLYWVRGQLGIADGVNAMGRGSQAQIIVRQIQDSLA